MKKVMKEITEFNNARNWGEYHTPENLAKSISIEAAELLECFQWTSDFNKEAVCEELADVMIYSMNMAQCLGVDMEEIILKKMEKNAIKYPVEK